LLLKEKLSTNKTTIIMTISIGNDHAGTDY